jgi:hypothetical protein
MIAVTILSALGVALDPATPPTFPLDFYTGSQDNVAIVQGGYFTEGGGCCSAHHSPQCKIQAASSGSDVFQQGSKQRVRMDSARGSIVTDYVAKKQMAIVPTGTPHTKFQNSTHKYVCAQYCPTQAGFHSMVSIGDPKGKWLSKPHDRGQKTITQPAAVGGKTKTCEEWTWDDAIFGLVPMSKNSMCVATDESNKPSPWFMSMIITPFGGKPLGVENASFVQFTPRTFDAATDGYFDIDPESVEKCQMSQQCQQNSKSAHATSEESHAALESALAELHERSPALSHLRFRTTMRDEAERRAKAGSVEEEAAGEAPPARRLDDPPTPKYAWAKDWTALEDASMTINQGGKVTGGGDICCDGSVPQCQVQYQHMHGQKYFDFTNSRERFEDEVAGEVNVADYHKGMDMLVGPDGACKEFCPIDPADAMEPFDPFDEHDKVQDWGEVPFGEMKGSHHYRWAERILKVIKMQTTDLYLDDSDAKNPKPLKMTTSITPFGLAKLGEQVNTWQFWTPGTPPKEKFAITGVDTCKKSSNCGSSSKQAHRLRRGDLHTFYSYMEA